MVKLNYTEETLALTLGNIWVKRMHSVLISNINTLHLAQGTV